MKDNFIISPVLTLPETFRSAYVGEEFACTLSANNELLPSDTSKSVSGVRVTAEMTMPSSETLTLDFENEDGSEETAFGPGDHMQKIVRLSLSESGQHTLGVTVTYTETQLGQDGGAASGRARTFRKLYQFVAQPLINVKTKAGDVAARKDGKARYALEAQLQNLGDRTVCLEVCHYVLCCYNDTDISQAVSVNPAASFQWRSLNWDAFSSSAEPAYGPILHPNDTLQVAFLLEENSAGDAQLAEIDDRITLGQLNIQWRSAMGDRGSLKTSWLTGRRR